MDDHCAGPAANLIWSLISLLVSLVLLMAMEPGSRDGICLFRVTLY